MAQRDVNDTEFAAPVPRIAMLAKKTEMLQPDVLRAYNSAKMRLWPGLHPRITGGANSLVLRGRFKAGKKKGKKTEREERCRDAGEVDSHVQLEQDCQ